jgi:uncharacterized membrane protein
MYTPAEQQNLNVMDWNWFFSSLAQSVAALVGVFAAFIITKIINNQATFAQQGIRTKEILSVSEKHKEAAANRYFRWYNERRMDEALKDLRELFNEPVKSAEEYYALVAFPKYVSRADVIQKINDLLPRPIVESSHAGEEATGTFRKPSYPHIRMPELLPDRQWQIFEAGKKQKLWESVQAEGEQIQNLLLEIRQHIRVVNLQIANTKDNPETSRLISFSIGSAALLFFVGVIYPLSFLPYSSNQYLSIGGFFFILFSLKGLILTIVSTIFSTIMIVFWRVNSSLKYNDDERSKLAEAAEVRYYSGYFEIRAKNAAEHNEWLQSFKTDGKSTGT